MLQARTSSQRSRDPARQDGTLVPNVQRDSHATYPRSADGGPMSECHSCVIFRTTLAEQALEIKALKEHYRAASESYAGLLKTTDAAGKEIERLREALRRYGVHLARCATHHAEYVDGLCVMALATCDCGYGAALRATPEAE